MKVTFNRFFTLLVVLCSVFSIFAEMPNTVAYRGQLTDETGNALDATLDITFNIFDIATGGTSLWSETQSVVVTDGYFDVELGSVTALDLNFDSQYWVELTIGTETLTPRDKLTPTAFSIRSNIANKADSSLYSVSSSADHEGRIGHVRFIPGEGGSITEAAASSETDTIYIAIGGGTGTSSGTSYPPANVWEGNSSYRSSAYTETVFTVPSDSIFYLYGCNLQTSAVGDADAQVKLQIFDSSLKDIASASCISDHYNDMSSTSSPTVVKFDPPIKLEQGNYISFSMQFISTGTSFYGFAIYGWKGTE